MAWVVRLHEWTAASCNCTSRNRTIMSSNLSVPEAGSSGPPGRPDESEGSSAISDEYDLRRMRTGKRGRPPIDPTQKDLVEVRLKTYCFHFNFV